MEVKEKTVRYKEITEKSQTAAVIVAAGSSLRMGTNDKLFLTLGGIPVIVRTIMAFEKSNVEKIVVVTKKESVEKIKNLINEYNIKKVTDIVLGGKTRKESVLNGVKALYNNGNKTQNLKNVEDNSALSFTYKNRNETEPETETVCGTAVKTEIKNVLIHDGARPLVSQKIIEDVINALNVSLAAAPVIKITDTLKTINGFGEIINTVNRENTVAVQTPQGFNLREYLAAAEKQEKDFTDDCTVMENAGIKVKTVPGSKSNIKITYKEDLLLAEYLLKIM